MREIIGWILCGVGLVCGLRVMSIAARHDLPSQFDRRSYFESEYQHHKFLQKSSGFNLLVFLGLGLILLGLYLIGLLG